MRASGAPPSVAGEMPLPQRARRRVAVAAVDQRERRRPRQQPQVDVVERERQRHPQPEHARRDLDGLARRGRAAGNERGKSSVHRAAAADMAVRRRSMRYGIVPSALIAVSGPVHACTATCVARADRAAARDARHARRVRPLREASATHADLLDLRSRARVRADDARDPLLRGLRACSRPSGAGAQRVYGERERVRLKLILRGKRLGPRAVRDPRAARHVRGRRATSARSSSRFLDAARRAACEASAAEGGHRRRARRDRRHRARMPAATQGSGVEAD